MIAGLAACGQTTTTTPAADTMAKAPVEVLGFAAITFSDVNTDHMTVSVRTSSVEAGLAGLKSQDLSRPAKVTITQTSDRGAVQDTPATHRTMFAVLNVGNNSGAPYQNVTLSGVNIPGSFLYDTSLTDAQNIDGTQASLAQAHQLVPSNPRSYNQDTGMFGIPKVKADYQMYSEAYVQNITNFMQTRYGGTAFPYGFVARSKTNLNGSRAIAPGATTGQVTVAFATPDTTATDAPKDIKNFTFLGLITADAVTTASADVYEADLTRACAAVQGFGGSEAHGFIGQGAGGCTTEETEAGLRIAGPQAGPNTTITYASHP